MISPTFQENLERKHKQTTLQNNTINTTNVRNNSLCMDASPKSFSPLINANLTEV